MAIGFIGLELRDFVAYLSLRDLVVLRTKSRSCRLVAASQPSRDYVT